MVSRLFNCVFPRHSMLPTTERDERSCALTRPTLPRAASSLNCVAMAFGSLIAASARPHCASPGSCLRGWDQGRSAYERPCRQNWCGRSPASPRPARKWGGGDEARLGPGYVGARELSQAELVRHFELAGQHLLVILAKHDNRLVLHHVAIRRDRPEWRGARNRDEASPFALD